MHDQMNKLLELEKRRLELVSGKQSVESAYMEAMIDAAITILKCEQSIAVAKNYILLLDVYRKTGQLTAINSVGERKNGSWHTTGNQLTTFFNIRSCAHELAVWSLK